MGGDVPIDSDDPGEISDALRSRILNAKRDSQPLLSALIADIGSTLGPQSSSMWRCQAGALLASLCQTDGQMNRDLQLVMIGGLSALGAEEIGFCQAVAGAARHLAMLGEHALAEAVLIEAAKYSSANATDMNVIATIAMDVASAAGDRSAFDRVCAALPHQLEDGVSDWVQQWLAKRGLS